MTCKHDTKTAFPLEIWAFRSEFRNGYGFNAQSTLYGFTVKYAVYYDRSQMAAIQLYTS